MDAKAFNQLVKNPKFVGNLMAFMAKHDIQLDEMEDGSEGEDHEVPASEVEKEKSRKTKSKVEKKPRSKRYVAD